MILARHGDERAACVAMIDTYRRALGDPRGRARRSACPTGEVDVDRQGLPAHPAPATCAMALERAARAAGSNLAMRQLDLLFRRGRAARRLPRHIALHPCGIVLPPTRPASTACRSSAASHGYRMSQADKDDVELLGYLKLDVLGIRMLSSMRHAARRDRAAPTGEKVDLDADRRSTTSRPSS